jgi:maleamate amidohydrolase
MPVMESSDLTPRQYWAQVKANPNRAKFGFGQRPALVNIDLQRAYTDLAAFKTAYQTDPRQIEHINALSARVRALGLPVVWTYVAYLDSGEDAGVWGTRTNTPDSLQNIRHGSERAELDPRCDVQPGDIVMLKRMASPFFETNLWSLLTFHRIDTVIITGGSTSGCVRACAVDSLSRGFRTTVVEEAVADKHEIPHYANLCDMMLKYADVEGIADVLGYLEGLVSVR